MQEFKDGLKENFLKECEIKEFSKEEISEIYKLVDEKYSLYDWNVGRSPKGKNKFTKKFDFGIFTLTFDSDGGVIKNAEIYGDFFELKSVAELEKKLDGVKFAPSEVKLALSKIGEFIKGADESVIVDAIFE